SGAPRHLRFSDAATPAVSVAAARTPIGVRCRSRRPRGQSRPPHALHSRSRGIAEAAARSADVPLREVVERVDPLIVVVDAEVEVATRGVPSGALPPYG